MKKIVCLLIVTLFTINAVAQSAKVTTAWNYMNNYKQYGNDIKDLLKAKEAIDEAAENEKTKLSAKTFLYKGQIYALLASEDYEEKTMALNEAKTAFFKVAQMEKDSGKKAKYTADAMLGVRNLAPIFYNSGFDFYNGADYANAYSNFKNVVDINGFLRSNGEDVPVDTSAIYATANMASKIKKDDEAIKLYNQLIDLEYDNSSIYLGLANIYKSMGESAKATETIDLGLHRYPSDKALNIEKVNGLLSSGNQQEAIASMKDAIKVDPENPTLHFALGVAYDQQKDFDNAILSYKKALDLKTDYFDAYYNLGAVYYNQAAEKSKERNDLPLDDQANYDRLGKEIDDLFGLALPYLTKAYEFNPKDLGTVQALKEIYAITQQFDKSKEMKAVYDELVKSRGME